jgi:hypothetical protein
MKVPIPLIGPSYTNRSLPLSAQVTLGMYPEINPESRNVISLQIFPGLLEWAAESGIGRRMHEMAGVTYGVFGQTLYEFDQDGTGTSRGTIDGESLCDFADNGDQMMICTGGPVYMYTASTQTLAEITDKNLVNPTTVGYLNSQFIFDDNGPLSEPGSFVTTQLLTTLEPDNVVDVLDFAKADAHPDDITRIIIFNEMVYFFGPEGIEPWWNSGVGSPPFDEVQGAFRRYGLAGQWALAQSEELVFFLDATRVPRRMVGLSVANIGNPAIGQEWSKYTRVDDAIGLTYTLDHQEFFQLNFPTANKTWLYHQQSNSWTELAYSTDYQRHRAMSYLNVYDKNLVMDHSNGKIYELDFDTYTDDGEVIQRRRTTAMIHGGLYGVPGKELFFDQVEFVLQTGEGIASGQGSDPVLMVRFSDDSGRTWSAEEWYEVGKGGDYHKRVVMQNQGRAHGRIYELVYSEPTPFALIDANAEISVGI